MCLRLLSETANKTTDSVAQAAKDAEQDAQVDEVVDISGGVFVDFLTCDSFSTFILDAVDDLPLWNVTLHKQITDLLKEAGIHGTTIAVSVS